MGKKMNVATMYQCINHENNRARLCKEADVETLQYRSQRDMYHSLYRQDS